MRYNVKKKHLRKLARLWLRDYEAATPAEREEMVEAAEEVYTGMGHYLELRNVAEQGGTPGGYAITRHRGERGAYVCRDMHTNHMYVTHWGPGFDMWGKDFNMDDVSFDELDV